jgi:hypothetical protein
MTSKLLAGDPYRSAAPISSATAAASKPAPRIQFGAAKAA